MTWRDEYEAHPAADLFPMMSDAELDELAKDIRKNGMRFPPTVWRQGSDQNWTENWRDHKCVLLDGRNRLEAYERAGRRSRPNDAWFHGHEKAAIAFVISANVRRRHLTREQKGDVIAKLLKLAPERSDRQVAKDVGVDHKTVGAARKRAEDTGQITESTLRMGADGKSYPKLKPAPETALTSEPMLDDQKSGGEIPHLTAEEKLTEVGKYLGYELRLVNKILIPVGTPAYDRKALLEWYDEAYDPERGELVGVPPEVA